MVHFRPHLSQIFSSSLSNRANLLSVRDLESELNTFDKRSRYLGWAEVALRIANPDLPTLRLSAQSHYGPPDRLAFISVSGTNGDRCRRKKIADNAAKLLQRLGCTVELEPGRDVYDVKPKRPSSSHERLSMLRSLGEALRESAEGS